jgi:hypothetical protein
MSDAFLLLSSHSNSTSIMLILLMRMILTTLLVNELLNQMLIDHTCMFRIGCKFMMLITLTWIKTCLKVIKVSCFRLISLVIA